MSLINPNWVLGILPSHLAHNQSYTVLNVSGLTIEITTNLGLIMIIQANILFS